MSKKVSEKGLASGKRCQAFFLSEGFEAAVYQIPRSGRKPCQPLRLRATLSSGDPICIGAVQFLALWLLSAQSRFCR